MPALPTASQKSDSIQIGASAGGGTGDDAEDGIMMSGGKWEDEEERKFFEDIQDLKDFVPKNFLGIEDEEKGDAEEKERERAEKEKTEAEAQARKLEEELEGLKTNGTTHTNGFASSDRSECVEQGDG